jgi:hypothetical protein
MTRWLEEKQEAERQAYEPGPEWNFDVSIPARLIQDKALPSSAKIMYGVLRCFCIGNQHDTCDPSMTEIAEIANVLVTNVPKTIKLLEQRGYIEVARQGHGISNRYTLLKEKR